METFHEDDQGNIQKTKKRFHVNFRNMRSKLIVTMALLAIVPSVVVGIIATSYSTKSMMEESMDSSLEITKQVSYGIDEIINGISAQVVLLSSNDNFVENGSDNRKYALSMLNDMIESNSDFQAVYFATPDKRMLISPERDSEQDYDPTIRPWYLNGVKGNGKIVISDVYEDPFTKKFVMTISRAVVENGEVKGVIGVDIQLTGIADNVKEITMGKTGYVAIVDNHGMTIADRDPAKVGTKSMTKLDGWDKIASEIEGTDNFVMDKVSKFAAFDTSRTTGWKIISVIDKDEIHSLSKTIRSIVNWLLIAIVFVSTLVALFLSRGISLNLKRVKEGFAKASEGDLTTRIHVRTRDEFKELEGSFNDMMSNLSDSLKKVEQSSKTVLETSASLAVMTGEVSESTNQVSVAISEIATGTSSQAENAQSSVEEMSLLSTKLTEIEKSTTEISEDSALSKELSNLGLEQVNTLSEKSAETKQATDEVRLVIKEIEEKMIAINVILETISDITSQTNLLSLNASIEAARAGEHGRGFAVVANEVRKLAEQSKDSTVKIGEIINGIKMVVTQAVKAIDQTQVTVNEQGVAVEETKTLFKEILVSIDKLAKKASVAKENVIDSQRNKENVLNEIESISSVSEQVAASAQEVSASAEEVTATMEEFKAHSKNLENLANQLDSEIKKFTL